MRRHRTYQLLLAVVSLGLFLGLMTGCDNTFDPLEENDSVYFSIFGFLDATADTQWVRVTPVKETIWLDPEQYNFQVTLENMGTGETIQMQDSLFSYSGSSVLAYNFWTSEKLNPEESYKLTATRDDGNSSSVTMTLPPEFPTPVVTTSLLVIEGVERLADVKFRFHYESLSTGYKRIVALPKLYDARRAQNGTIQVYMGMRPQDIEYRASNFPSEGWRLVDRDIYVASAGPGWPEFASSGDLVSTIFDYQSNVIGGAGFVGGIVSKIFSFCVDENNNPVAC